MTLLTRLFKRSKPVTLLPANAATRYNLEGDHPILMRIDEYNLDLETANRRKRVLEMMQYEVRIVPREE